MAAAPGSDSAGSAIGVEDLVKVSCVVKTMDQLHIRKHGMPQNCSSQIGQCSLIFKCPISDAILKNGPCNAGNL